MVSMNIYLQCWRVGKLITLVTLAEELVGQEPLVKPDDVDRDRQPSRTAAGKIRYAPSPAKYATKPFPRTPVPPVMTITLSFILNNWFINLDFKSIAFNVIQPATEFFEVVAE